MSDPTSFRSIIELWPSREAMGAETGAGAGKVSKWWQRNSIPDEWWATVLATERVKAAGFTADDFVRLASRPLASPEPVEARA